MNRKVIKNDSSCARGYILNFPINACRPKKYFHNGWQNRSAWSKLIKLTPPCRGIYRSIFFKQQELKTIVTTTFILIFNHLQRDRQTAPDVKSSVFRVINCFSGVFSILITHNYEDVFSESINTLAVILADNRNLRPCTTSVKSFTTCGCLYNGQANWKDRYSSEISTAAKQRGEILDSACFQLRFRASLTQKCENGCLCLS